VQQIVCRECERTIVVKSMTGGPAVPVNWGIYYSASGATSYQCPECRLKELGDKYELTSGGKENGNEVD